MVQYASGSIKFSGLGSDTDFQVMIDKLQKIETRYANQLLRWKGDWEKRLEAFQQVRSEMLNLQTSLNTMNSMNKFLVKTASSSDEKVATGVAGADTLNGTYSLDVKQLASQYSWSKNTNLYSKNDVVCDGATGGTFQYRYKGQERSLFIPKGTTLEGLKNIINNDSQNPGVRAQLIVSQDGVVFQLNAKETGSANSVVIEKTDGMSAFGLMTLTDQKYLEQANSMTLVDPFSSPADVINSTGDVKTFVFSVAGKKASLPVANNATISDLVTQINTWWKNANPAPPTGEDEKIASLEETSPGQFTFEIKKNDTIFGAGNGNPALMDVLSESYAAATDTVPAGTYSLKLAKIDGSATEETVSVTMGASATLQDLLVAFQGAIPIDYNVSVAIKEDPADASKKKLVMGPVINDNMEAMLNQTWANDSVQIPPGMMGQDYLFRLTNSSANPQDIDIIKIALPATGTYTIRDFCNVLNTGLAGKGTAKLVSDGTNFKVVSDPRTITNRVTVEDGSLDTMNYALPGEASGTWLITKGENAKLRVNGWPKEPELLESASNTIAAGTMIDGMSLTLRSAGKAVISVSNDTQKMSENVENFVKAVNTFRTVIQSLTSYDEDKSVLDPDYAESQFEMQRGSVLTGNYGIQLLSSRLKTAVASSGVGFSHQMKDPLTGYVSGDFFSALSQLGITTNTEKGNSNYGLLEINRIEGYKGLKSLDQALSENPEAIARLFSTRSEGLSNNPELFQHASHIASIAKAGTYDVEYTVELDGSNNPYIATASINGKPAKIYTDINQIALLGPDNDPAKSITLDIYDLTIGVTHKGSVSIKDGKVNELLAMMDGTEGLLGSKGTLKNLENNYQTIIKNIEKKIKQEDDRLTKWRRTMDLKFSRLEAVLAKYNNINEGLKSQIAQLGGSSKS